jgi:hypothetical protein
MKIKQTILTLSLAVAFVSAAALTAVPVSANTQQPIDQADSTPVNSTSSTACPEDQAPAEGESCCGGAKTSIIGCSQTGTSTGVKDNGAWYLLILALNIMTAGVGILAVGGIAYGAALYASASDKPDQAKQGMTYIKNVVIGLAAYGLMYVILNFLIPGGIFS